MRSSWPSSSTSFGNTSSELLCRRRLGDPFAQAPPCAPAAASPERRCRRAGRTRCRARPWRQSRASSGGSCAAQATAASRPFAVGEPVRPGGEHEGSDEPLHVPLPGRRQRLVEVVDVEDEPAFGRGKAAEIHQVAITARLDANTGRRRMGQIGRHDRRGAAIEGERRSQHAAIAKRHQLLHAGRVGGAKDADRVGSMRRRSARQHGHRGTRCRADACRTPFCPWASSAAGDAFRRAATRATASAMSDLLACGRLPEASRPDSPRKGRKLSPPAAGDDIGGID